jgi:hypothetical protein
VKEEIVMWISDALGLVLSALPLATQDAAAQLAEKKVLNLAAAQKMVAAAQAEAERNHCVGVIAVASRRVLVAGELTFGKDGEWKKSRQFVTQVPEDHRQRPVAVP